MLETSAAPAAVPAPPAPVPSPSTGSTAVDSASVDSSSAGSPSAEPSSIESSASTSAESTSAETGEDRFLDYVPPQVIADASLPLAYQLVSPAGYGDQRVSFRAATSTHARAKVFTPLPYHKPITRCYGGRE